MSEALDSLRQISSSHAITPDEIWDEEARPHVDGINEEAVAAIKHAIGEAATSRNASPIGVPIVGQRGAGKTHLIGQARRLVQFHGGYFFRANITTIDDFWPNMVGGFLDGLFRNDPTAGNQLTVLLNRLVDQARLDPATRQRLLVSRDADKEAVDRFIQALSILDRSTVQETRHTLRALTLLASSDFGISDLADSYLRGVDDVFDPEGIVSDYHPRAQPAKKVVRDLSWLVAMTGPSMIAVDQIDEMVTSSRIDSDQSVTAERVAESVPMLDMIGNGLMDLRENTRRSVALVACLPGSWKALSEHCAGTVSDRFNDQVMLSVLPSAEVAEELVASTLRPAYQRTGFSPPYPTYPMARSCFAIANQYTPRRLLQVLTRHVNACVRTGQVTELTDLRELEAPVPRVTSAASDSLSHWDARFAAYCDGADIETAKNPATQDSRIPELLSAGLYAWIAEDPQRGNEYKVDPPPGSRPDVHARLRRVDDSGEHRWAFRAIGHTTAQSVRPRVVSFRERAGLGQGMPQWHGILWITTPDWANWTANSKTQREVELFAQHGTILIASDHDLRVLAALQRLGSEHDAGYFEWLRCRRPAGNTALFKTVFGPPPSTTDEVSSISVAHEVSTVETPRDDETLVLGHDKEFGTAVELSLRALCKHVSVFAGSGSGKTVFLRRLVEECALRGVSSIVLDPNNDLTRLDEPWPQPPEGWRDGDPAAAKEYCDETDVVIWTPGRRSGRSLSFQPLPDFAAVADDEDEFAVAVDTAVNALAPRALIDKSTARSIQRRAVLKEALHHFGRRGDGGFEEFLRLLENLPAEAASLGNAAVMAAELAETLRAVQVDDRLFAGDGNGFDPGVLLTPPEGKRARVSVINFLGLPSESQRQGFINQMQMALFSWLKQHPARDRELGGLLVMDEAQTFAPAMNRTVCTESTLALVAQARKYGLGLVFATQAPKGIHNQIVGNSATHFYGRLNAPVQVAAAEEVAEAKGGSSVDIAHLSTGNFYAVREGEQTSQVATPMCLSHHPPTAPTSDEILHKIRDSESS